MIYQNYPSHKAKSLPVVTYYQGPRVDYSVAKQKAEARNITLSEFWRRNTIVERQAKECEKYTVGKDYMPESKPAQEEYGLCCVKGIFKNYTEVPIADEWPKDDQPYPMTVWSYGKSMMILCMENWLNPEPVETVVASC